MRGITTEDYLSVANTIRGLSMDAVQKANSGHPGLPMGMADVAAVLWLRHLNHTSSNPTWANRDRFILSGGHGSALLYSLLHLSEFAVTIEDLKQFRQLGFNTPGHPELGRTEGVEATTGPLGQGIANAVGTAIAERMMASRFNTSDAEIFNHHTYVFCGDGDMMEGISHEASSIAGHLKLNKLILFYDSNKITIEGSTEVTFTEDVKARYKAYGWKIIDIDGHDPEQIDKAIRKAKRTTDAPTLIFCRTTIGFGSPNRAGTAKAHGEPLGAEEIRLAKQTLGLPPDETFYVPETTTDIFAKRNASAKRTAKRWERLHKTAVLGNPEAAEMWKIFYNTALPAGLEDQLPTFDKPTATRAAFGKVIQALAEALPNLVGGSADLAPSNKSWLDAYAAITPTDFSGRNIQYGVREFAMAAIQNGLVAYGGLRSYVSTFFVFSDYLRPAARLAALTHLPAIYAFTHDSFYVGEDGPTHQPVEHLAAMRAIPNMTVIRPADASETGAAMIAAFKNTTGPTSILFTRQNLPVLERTETTAPAMLEKGAYTLFQNGSGTPDLTIIATGSEVSLALKAAAELNDVNVRVVNMPSWELFEKQTAAYRDQVLDPGCCKRMVVEAGSSFGWAKYIGSDGATVTLDTFGDSAPAEDLEKHFGFTVENVVAKARALIA